MTTTTHTPGPWHVDDLGEEFFLETNHRYGIGSDSSLVHRVAKVEGLGDEYLANAYLIAAAPELLAACEAALPWLVDAKAIAQCREAIAKATGNHEEAH